MAGNIIKNATKPVDEYLKFVQQSFNTADVSFVEILKQLDAFTKFANSPKETIRKQDSTLLVLSQAQRLKHELSKITILTDFNKYKKFEKLGNLGLDNKGLKETYTAADEIIQDIQVARQWIDSYKLYSTYLNQSGVHGLHEELILLGKSILGRAIELTPKKTGFLRKSGALYDFGSYIIIAFTAPYATYVHENLEIAHPQHASNPNCGGRAKFLEIALQEFFPDRHVWTEIHGFSGVMAKIGINPEWLEYSHYD